MGLVVLPSGLVVYEFEGVIHANGLLIPEASSESGAQENRVEWIDPGGILRESIMGALTGPQPTALLTLIANVAEPRRKIGFVSLQALDELNLQAALKIQSAPEPAARNIKLEAAPAPSVFLWTGQGRSSFVQAAGLGTQAMIVARGSVTVKWAVKGIASAAKVVNHGLGAEPIAVTGSGGFNGSYVETAGYTAEHFEIRAVSTTGEIEAGTERVLNWIAVA
jgi:hypothetical protein